MTAASAATPPRWVRALFWCIVSLEWAFVVGSAALVLVPLWHAPTRAALVEMLCLGPDTTVYAGGFSEPAWQAVRAGDTQATVQSRLGEPLYRWSLNPDDEWWSYSRHGTVTDDYRERKVRFSLEGRVLEKHEECYID